MMWKVHIRLSVIEDEDFPGPTTLLYTRYVEAEAKDLAGAQAATSLAQEMTYFNEWEIESIEAQETSDSGQLTFVR